MVAKVEIFQDDAIVSGSRGESEREELGRGPGVYTVGYGDELTNILEVDLGGGETVEISSTSERTFVGYSELVRSVKYGNEFPVTEQETISDIWEHEGLKVTHLRPSDLSIDPQELIIR